MNHAWCLYESASPMRKSNLRVLHRGLTQIPPEVPYESNRGGGYQSRVITTHAAGPVRVQCIAAIRLWIKRKTVTIRLPGW